MPVVEGCQPITVGVPLPRGQVTEPCWARVLGREGQPTAADCRPLAWWPDGSVKWLLVEFLSPALAAGTSELALEFPLSSRSASASAVVVDPRPGVMVIDTGPVVFQVDCRSSGRSYRFG